MEIEFHIRSWDELIPNILGLIFMKVLFYERLIVIPRMCKKWYNVVEGPYSWREILIDYIWSSCLESSQIENLVQILIKRSCGSLRKLGVYELKTEEIFTFIAENVGANIQSLSLPKCSIKDSSVKQITEKLWMITTLDLSYCMEISISAIETIGRNCKHLEVFHRKMHPSDTFIRLDENSEAFAIASSMPNLKRLEICYNNINNDGAKKVLSSCRKLEFLNLRVCWDVDLDEVNVKEIFSNIQILGPKVLVYYNIDDSTDYSDSDLENIYEFYFEDVVWSDEEGFYEEVMDEWD